MENLRHIPCENIQNCRDLGGYPIRGGGATKFGRLLRCGIPKKITAADMDFLKQYGVKTVFDLRGDLESIAIPSGIESDPFFDYNQISLLEVNPAEPNTHVPMPEIYLSTICDCADNVGWLFKKLSKLTEPAMFHCFLGKDRTGITAALILTLNGVYFEDVVADYAASAAYLEPFYRYEIEHETGLIWEQDPDKLDSKSVNILRVFEYIERVYGTVEDYLMAHNVTAKEIDRVCELLR